MLKQVREIIKGAAPDADERISYQMPYYDYYGRLIYFAGYKTYVGLYIMSDARDALEKELEPYKTSKATYKFPVDNKLPVNLIKKIVKTQAAANRKRAAG